MEFGMLGIITPLPLYVTRNQTGKSTTEKGDADAKCTLMMPETAIPFRQHHAYTVDPSFSQYMWAGDYQVEAGGLGHLSDSWGGPSFGPSPPCQFPSIHQLAYHKFQVLVQSWTHPITLTTHHLWVWYAGFHAFVQAAVQIMAKDSRHLSSSSGRIKIAAHSVGAATNQPQCTERCCRQGGGLVPDTVNSMGFGTKCQLCLLAQSFNKMAYHLKAVFSPIIWRLKRKGLSCRHAIFTK